MPLDNLFDDYKLVKKTKAKPLQVEAKAITHRPNIRPIEIMTDSELIALPVNDIFVFDIECYHNLFFVAFKHVGSGKYIIFEQSAESNLNIEKLSWLMHSFCLVGFNSINYDVPMITLAMRGVGCFALKEASDFIIKNNNTPSDFKKFYNVDIFNYNHIDLIEVAPLQGSLKLYAGRLHCERMQDLPIAEDKFLTAIEAEVLRHYCCNDLSNTELLYKELKGELQLREDMTKMYEVELRSKSDAQVAEAVIKSELKKVLGKAPFRPRLPDDMILKYNVPYFVKYNTLQLRTVLDIIAKAEFKLDALGSPIMPQTLEDLTVNIGNATYKLGMGGLHSMEKCVAHISTDEIIIADNDVESFYPRIILNQQLAPTHLGNAFLTVYENIVNTRIDAKKKAKTDKHYKIIADSLKITINGSFGKFGNKYSTLYAPQLMLQVTITGQLVLLMLIEMLELAGIEVISGNTDGIVSKYHKSRHEEVRHIIALWEKQTSFKTEETFYDGLYSRDVNTYIAIKQYGEPDSKWFDEKLGCKTKGAFCERGSALNSRLSKNPETVVCIDAVLNYLVNQVPLEQTIKECTDFTRFVSVRNVKGGGEKDGQYLGKVIRWYYAKEFTGFINYVISGNKVAKTDGARPVMDLPLDFPSDIDYNKYIEIAKEMLYDCGCLQQSKKIMFF